MKSGSNQVGNEFSCHRGNPVELVSKHAVLLVKFWAGRAFVTQLHQHFSHCDDSFRGKSAFCDYIHQASTSLMFWINVSIKKKKALRDPILRNPVSCLSWSSPTLFVTFLTEYHESFLCCIMDHPIFSSLKQQRWVIFHNSVDSLCWKVLDGWAVGVIASCLLHVVSHSSKGVLANELMAMSHQGKQQEQQGF